MADFFQNGVITTLHHLDQRPLEALEAELASFADERPMALILPSLYSELEGPALPGIVKNLCHAHYISDIIIGLDQADESQFHRAREFFAVLPQRTHILWQDGPRLRELDRQLAEKELAPQQAGKGRNAWYCMGYALAQEGCEAVALHDCDIVTHDRYLPARLLYPVANPEFNFEFCKGYYARIATDRLSGRVTRLFVTPLIRSLKKILGALDYLEFMDSFRYPLSGEFSLRKDLLRNVRIPSDWGLEVGVLSEVYRNLSLRQVCQVDIADYYDHKHQDISKEDPAAGLAKMAAEIAKAVFRKLATEGVTFSMEFFRTIKASYYRTALDSIEQYFYDARINDLQFDRHSEEQSVEIFAQSIMLAGESFLANPMETPFIPNWNRVLSAMPEMEEQLLAAVALDNA
jgi:glucosyl-3-phosphoglycerate synthase